LLLLCGVCPFGRAGVVVLANRTARDLTFTAAGTSQQTVASFDQAVLYTDGSMTVSFSTGKQRKTYRVEPDSAYFFADLPGGDVALSGIGEAGSNRPADATGAKGDGVLLKPPPLETIQVRIFVDEEEPATQAVWEVRLRKRIAAASAVLERSCRVRIEVASAGTWNSDNGAPDLPALLTDFEHKLPRGDTRLLIGFTSQRTPEGGGTLHLGGTRLPLHPYILTREWTPTTEPGRLEVLLHEFGHYLGAVHSPETTSVMRPKLGDGRSVSLKFPVGFDPLNTLAMNLIVGEVRARRIHSLAQVSAPTKERLRQIYQEVQTANPDDPTPATFIARLGPPPSKPDPLKPEIARPDAPGGDAAKAGGAAAAPRGNELEKNARVIIAAIVKAAEKNQRLPDRSTPGTAPPFRRSGDSLTEYYFREAAIAARDLPQGEAAPAFLVGLAIALDDADLFRKNPVTGALWRRIEPDEQRELRLKVIGQPTMYGRHDSCQHFVDSAALVVVRGPVAAEAAGIVKELLDSQDGGSGFSFADLASDMSGVAFGREVLAEPGLLLVLPDNFVVADYAVPPDGLVEGLRYAEFAERYGRVNDPRFLQEHDKLRKRVRELPAYRPAAAPQKPAPEKPAEKPAPEKVAAVNPPLEKAPAPEAPPRETPPVNEAREKAAPAKEMPEVKAPEKTAPEPAPAAAPPAATPPSPPPEPAPHTSAPTPPEPSALVLGMAGLGMVSLIGSLIAIWPRQPVLEKGQAVRTPILAGVMLALAGFGLLGAAYARWSMPAATPEAVPELTGSDLEPAWTEPPVNPFEIPMLQAIRLPSFSEPRSIQGATGRDGRGHIWLAVSAGGEVEPSAKVLEYDPDSGAVTDRGDVLDKLNGQSLLRPGESQGTIRTRFVQAGDGYLYFASTGTAGTDGPASHLWRIRPADGHWEHLSAVPEKVVAAACGGSYVFFLGYHDDKTSPQNVLYQYDRKTGQTRSARVSSVAGHFSTAVVADHRGHVYVPGLKPDPAGVAASLVELNRDLEEVSEAPLDPPAAAGNDEALGLVAAQPLADGSTACVTDRGFLHRVTPGEGARPAKVAALGAFYPRKQSSPRKESSVAALFSPDGRRYLMGLARPQGWRDGRYEWLVFDLSMGHSVVVPVPAPEEDGRPVKDLVLAGCMTRDDQGRFYVGGSCHRNGTDCPALLQIRLSH
jgi:hypothetical protein